MRIKLKLQRCVPPASFPGCDYFIPAAEIPLSVVKRKQESPVRCLMFSDESNERRPTYSSTWRISCEMRIAIHEPIRNAIGYHWLRLR